MATEECDDMKSWWRQHSFKTTPTLSPERGEEQRSRGEEEEDEEKVNESTLHGTCGLGGKPQ
jgi:hypothetical protein